MKSELLLSIPTLYSSIQLYKMIRHQPKYQPITEPILFDTLHFTDIKQGSLGSCWLLSPLALAVCLNPKAVASVFREYDTTKGYAKLEIDHNIICIKLVESTDWKMTSNNTETWCKILELAVAKSVANIPEHNKQ